MVSIHVARDPWTETPPDSVTAAGWGMATENTGSPFEDAWSVASFALAAADHGDCPTP
jgi:hypothetical protein